MSFINGNGDSNMRIVDADMIIAKIKKRCIGCHYQDMDCCQDCSNDKLINYINELCVATKEFDKTTKQATWEPRGFMTDGTTRRFCCSNCFHEVNVPEKAIFDLYKKERFCYYCGYEMKRKHF